jgi:hypothetical protein
VKLRNTYSENYVEKEFNVSKILENRELTAGQFNFKLYEKSPSAKSFVLLDTLTNDKDGNISFDRKYTVKDVGDWIYSMVEPYHQDIVIQMVCTHIREFSMTEELCT